MAEIRIKSYEQAREIALIKEGKLDEYYIEQNKDIKTEGNIYIGIVEDIIPGMEAAFVNIGTEKNSFIHLKDLLPKVDETKEKYDESIKVTDVVEPKQKLLVQVKKDSSKQKGARTSTHINISSKYLAFMPNTEIITVSQKITDEAERERLKKIVKKHILVGNGAVIRTSAENKTEEELLEDIVYLNKKWLNLIGTLIDPKQTKPVKLYDSQDIVEKMLIDLVDEKFEKIVVTSKEEFEKIEKLKKEHKELSDTMVEIKGMEEIFCSNDLIKQIEKNKQRKIWLKCGGFITIDGTEALTAIDVNTGKFTGKKDLETTILKVNKEATAEIVKQIKLRDIGGIIIIDYIDMKKKEDKQMIEVMLKEELKKDRAKTQVEGFTKLDLMEMTRKTIYGHQQEIKNLNNGEKI